MTRCEEMLSPHTPGLPGAGLLAAQPKALYDEPKRRMDEWMERWMGGWWHGDFARNRRRDRDSADRRYHQPVQKINQCQTLPQDELLTRNPHVDHITN